MKRVTYITTSWSTENQWAYAITRCDLDNGLQTNRRQIVSRGGFTSQDQAYTAGELQLGRIVDREAHQDLCSPLPIDSEVLQAQVSANRRDPHCEGVY